MKYAVAVDIGGTNTRVALIDDQYQILNRVQFSTNANDPDETLWKIKEVVDSFNKDIQGIGMSCPGPLDLLEGKILTTPNLHGKWHGYEVSKELEKLVGKAVYLENDANLAGLAEACIGEGKDCRIVQYLTVSTGLGAGLVIDKKIFQGAHGFANEVANSCMKHNGPSHGSIYPGGIEALSSGTAIEQRAKTAGLDVAHAGQVNDLALAGNTVAKEIMDEAKLYLANYIAMIQAYIDPEIFILGGSVALKIDGFVEEVEELVKSKVYSVVRPFVKVRKSTLNEDSGLLGAACLVFESLSAFDDLCD